ncbi:two-component sensor histidine kinase [Filimonas lacunae]|nr:two-component sensor histidine kinase [Filimonas lacunae]
MLLSNAPVALAQKHPEYITQLSNETLYTDTNAIKQAIKEARTLEDDYLDSAINKLRVALKSSFRLKYNKGIFACLTDMGVIFHIHNQNAKSIDVLKQALPYCDTSKQGRTWLLNTYLAIGYRYEFIDMKDSAGNYYYKALDAIEHYHIDNVNALTKTYFQIIFFWLNMAEDTEKPLYTDKYINTAVAYLNKAEQQVLSDNKIALCRITLSKGNIHYMKRELKDARVYYRRFLQLAALPEAKDLSSFITQTYAQLSRTYLDEQIVDSALYYAQKAVQHFKENGAKDTALLIGALYYQGEAYIQQKKYARAISVITPALTIAKTQPLSRQYHGHHLLSMAYQAMGNYKAAWEHQKAYSNVIDSLSQERNLRSISQMEIKYEVAERDKELARRELTINSRDNKIKTQRLWLYVTIAVAISILLIHILLFRQIIHKQRIAALRMQQEKEMALLQAMIEGEEKERLRIANELHDGIGGLLGTIYMQLGAAIKAHHLQNDAAFTEVLQMQENAYEELRKVAHNFMPDILQQEGLEVATRVFCNRVRNTDAIDINYEVVGDIPRFRPSLELASYRIIQELTHNILKHANASEALIQLAYIGNCLSVTVEDNGIGIQGTPGGNKTGMGIHTIQDRIKKMGGRFDLVSSKNNGTSINLHFVITEADLILSKN